MIFAPVASAVPPESTKSWSFAALIIPKFPPDAPNMMLVSANCRRSPVALSSIPVEVSAPQARVPVVVRFSLLKLIAPELSVTLPEPIVSVPAVNVSNQPFSHLTPVEPRLSVLSVSERILEPLVMPPVATCVAVVVRTPVTSAVLVTIKSSCTLRSTTLRLAKASTTAAPEPAPSK